MNDSMTNLWAIVSAAVYALEIEKDKDKAKALIANAYKAIGYAMDAKDIPDSKLLATQNYLLRLERAANA